MDEEFDQASDRQDTMFEDSATAFPESEATEPSREEEMAAYEDQEPTDSPEPNEMAARDGLPQEEADHQIEPSHHLNESLHTDTAATGTASVSEPPVLAPLTIDDFAALEERVLRAVNLVRRERQARRAAEERLLLLESEVLANAPALEHLQQEVDSLHAERDQVRQRVERLLRQLDALEV